MMRIWYRVCIVVFIFLSFLCLPLSYSTTIFWYTSYNVSIYLLTVITFSSLYWLSSLASKTWMWYTYCSVSYHNLDIYKLIVNGIGLFHNILYLELNFCHDFNVFDKFVVFSCLFLLLLSFIMRSRFFTIWEIYGLEKKKTVVN